MSPGQAARQLGIEMRGIILALDQKAIARSRQGVNILRNTAMEVLGHDGSGRRYGKHVASAPGEPPAPDKVNLRRNWRQMVWAGFNGKGLSVTIKMRITSDMFYEKFLEHGTRKMAPRPFHNRIKTKARPKIEALFSSI